MDRSFTFQSEGCVQHEGACTRAIAETLTVVPEPSPLALLLAAAATAGLAARRRARPQVAQAELGPGASARWEKSPGWRANSRHA